MTEYKSPAHKILKVLKVGRDQWKEKTVLAKYENKKLKRQLKYAQNRIDKLSTELDKCTKEKKSANPLESVIGI
jgi:hypothetical protein